MARLWVHRIMHPDSPTDSVHFLMWICECIQTFIPIRSAQFVLSVMNVFPDCIFVPVVADEDSPRPTNRFSALIESGRIDEAMKFCEGLYPDHALEVLMSTGETLDLENTEQAAIAVRLGTEAAKSHPDYPGGSALVMKVHLGQMNVDEAIAFARTVPPTREVGASLSHVAWQLMTDSKFEEALQTYEAMVEIDKDGYFSRAQTARDLNNGLIACLRLTDFERAQPILDAALAVGAQNPDIFHNAACILALRGDLTEALASCRQARDHEYRSFGSMQTDTDLEALFELPEFQSLFL